MTPYSAVVPDKAIVRIKENPSAEIVGKFGTAALQQFEKKGDLGLIQLKFLELQKIRSVSTKIVPSKLDLIWLYGQFMGTPDLPGWIAFMEHVTHHRPYQRSFVHCLTFINAPASDYDTLFTALIMAAEKCKALKQKTCFVTYDLPLYMKIIDIF